MFLFVHKVGNSESWSELVAITTVEKDRTVEEGCIYLLVYGIEIDGYWEEFGHWDFGI
jgi:hypothetical protein